MRPHDVIPEHPDGAPHARLAPPERLTRGAPLAVLRALPGSRAVGGCVRDALAGRPIADVDVGVPLPPGAAVPLLRAAGLKVVETGLAHGTVTAIGDGEPVEVTSLRRDVATDGRHAEVEWTADWREDAARRDFTINAMSMDAEGNLWDWFGGRGDLAAGVVRFVGDPATRLREDYLRALRFFRFQARYGTGAPDAAALAAIRQAVPGLARLSAERVWSETKRLLAAPDPSGALRLMLDTGVLAAILPEALSGIPEPAALAERIGALRRGIAAGLPPDPVLRLAALLPPVCAVPADGSRGACASPTRSGRCWRSSRTGTSRLTRRRMTMPCAAGCPCVAMPERRRAKPGWPSCATGATARRCGHGSRRCRCRDSRSRAATPWPWVCRPGHSWGECCGRWRPGGGRTAAGRMPEPAVPD
ncbi:CCA tRNA nucleotidyltransferase [Roseomonas sp. FDAARGOS_362]|uniref:CCA tRNA nucleotidyltransferase n=1 Tax=Roseomonas sp. FDAARGOS_362 TaxID=2018065 RepID=UPI001D0032B3|nr:CCA tRNA nucleotidyltransferase [Roseomonas sp. FDAARGOS_362]USQ72626.1 CCA tRNA nucleotidyltransferase [Roseomonas mucosa]